MNLFVSIHNNALEFDDTLKTRTDEKVNTSILDDNDRLFKLRLSLKA